MWPGNRSSDWREAADTAMGRLPMTEPHTFRTSAIPTSPTPTGQGDLASALAAMELARAETVCANRRRMGRPAKRAMLTLTFVALLISGVINLLTLTPGARESAASGSRASIVFSNAQTGACLNWPPDAPDKPSFVQCRADHLFEVAKPVGMNSFGEPCQLAVREYLGTRYDPNSRFTISVLWAGDADGTRVDDRNLLCGLQLLGPGGRPIAFKGSIAELDQSKVWPVGTCLGIDSANRSTDIPVDCTAPHALEVTGAVSLAERFPAEMPAEPEQRAFLEEECARLADAYLAPLVLSTSGVALGYEPLSPASWSAGSRQVSCSVGRPGEQGWTAAVGSARSPTPGDVPAPASAPESTSEAPPPPVYEEPLIPIGPLPTVVPPSPAPAPSPSAATTTAPGPPPPAEPPPPPPPTESPVPEPGVLLIPGLPPIYLPGYVPPPPPAEPLPAPPA